MKFTLKEYQEEAVTDVLDRFKKSLLNIFICFSSRPNISFVMTVSN